MKRSVTFSFADGTGEMTGYEGAPLPCDKMAELVFSSTNNPIRMITVQYDGGATTDWRVKWASEPLPGIPCKPVWSVRETSVGCDCLWSGQTIAKDGFCSTHKGS